MTRFWLFLVVFLLILSVFRLANGAEFIGLSEILIKLENTSFDMTPLTELVEFFDSSSSSTYASAGGGPNAGGGHFGSDEPDTVMEKIEAFFNDIRDFCVIVMKVLVLPFKIFFQLFGIALWMLGFTA